MDSSLFTAPLPAPGPAGSGFDSRHPWRSSSAELDAAYWEAVRLHRLGRNRRARSRWFRFRRSADIR
ncbi:hypothetical protein ACFV5N_08825 [Streptomyces sp. NPDC059853]|uniref:hypothetical protein n=1 Tax=Streptomyces sp. NPDC059853 TaxID=3346973 RepID=UPI003656DE11